MKSDILNNFKGHKVYIAEGMLAPAVDWMTYGYSLGQEKVGGN